MPSTLSDTESSTAQSSNGLRRFDVQSALHALKAAWSNFIQQSQPAERQAGRDTKEAAKQAVKMSGTNGGNKI